MEVFTENWGEPPQSWLDYARDNWTGKDRLEKTTGRDPIRMEFVARATQAFAEHGIPVKRIRTWINVEVPQKGEGWSDGYPHTHKNADGVMLIHYIEPGDKPSPLGVVTDEGVTKIYPEAGLTAFMPDGISHGAFKNNGTTNRVALMALALP